MTASSTLTLIRQRFHPLWHIRRTPWLHRLFSTIDFPVWIRLPDLGMSMRGWWFRDLPWLLSSLEKEPEMKRLFTQLCEILRPKVFWDCGANLGWFSWMVYVWAKPERTLLIEALPKNAALLEATLAKNGITGARVVGMALADRCGETSFVVDHKSGATSQLKELFETTDETAIAHAYGLDHEITVQTTTVDRLLEEGERPPDLMKVDVEEAEQLVFQGAGNLLRAGQTVVVFELSRPEAVAQLRTHGYEVYRVDACANYLAVPASLRERLASITDTLERSA
jgi:FkbM family methyltransferase